LFFSGLRSSAIRDFSRQKVEEAIVALLVLPAPQNLLMQKIALDKLPANAAPLDSLLLVARHLGESFVPSERRVCLSVCVIELAPLPHSTVIVTPLHPRGFHYSYL
jgi:hypothetical protein